jgi:hypothetical protein
MNETMFGYLSIALLSAVGMLCTAGVLSSSYNDTLMQRIGLALVAIWCAARVSSKLAEPSTEAIHLMLHAGMATYAVGTWIKFIPARQPAPRELRVLDDVQVRSVSGGSHEHR